MGDCDKTKFILMKYLLSFAMFLSPSLCMSQTREDFDDIMMKFVRYYNAKQIDSIHNLASDSWGDGKAFLWNDKSVEKLHKEYGKIISHKYAGEDTNDYNIQFYKMVAEKKVFMTGLTLEEDKKLGTFRFHTSSRFIDSLLKATK